MERKVACHLSIDDSGSAFVSLRERNAGSLWDSGYFRKLLGFHRQHGAVFTLYLLHMDALDGLCPEILRELAASSSWLRFSYHGNDEDLGDGTFPENFALCTRKIAGLLGENSLTDILRVHRFKVDLRTAGILRDCGIRILLAADDGRTVSALSEEENASLLRDGEVCSCGMVYLRTDIRLERDSWHDKYGEWKKSGRSHIVVFSHEYLLTKDGSTSEELFRRLEFILSDIESSFESYFI